LKVLYPRLVCQPSEKKLAIKLIVEGDADREAVPLLFRRVAEYRDLNVFHESRPIKSGPLAKICRNGELERYLRYAAGSDNSPVFLVLDCDVKFYAFCFIEREYETFFLHSIESIRDRYEELPWNQGEIDNNTNPESRRGAKEYLGRLMGKSYRETRDQARFTPAIDLELLYRRSRSFRHFVSAITALSIYGDS
jgi:hypothetical protein